MISLTRLISQLDGHYTCVRLEIIIIIVIATSTHDLKNVF